MPPSRRLSDRLAVDPLPAGKLWSLQCVFPVMQTGNDERTWNKHVSNVFFREGKLSLFLACVALTGFTTARWAAGEGLQTSWYLPCKLQAICCQSDHKAFFSAALWTSVQPVSAKDYQQLLTNWTESSVNGCLTVASRSLGLCDSWAMSYQIG